MMDRDVREPRDRVISRRALLQGISLLLGSLGWPVAARGPQHAKLPTIGFLGPTTFVLDSHRIGAFVQRLRELGWIEGRNVSIEYRWGEGRVERLGELAATARTLGLEVVTSEIRRPEDIAPAFEALKGRAECKGADHADR